MLLCGLHGNTHDLQAGDAYLSYLPYPHAYEQIMLSNVLVWKMKIGYY